MRCSAVMCALALLGVATPTRADLDFSRVVSSFSQSRALVAGARFDVPRAFLDASGVRVPLVVERQRASATLPPGAVVISERWSTLDLDPSNLGELGRYPGLGFHWSPPRHLLMDRAAAWTRVGAFRSAGGGSGRGVVIGLVDTGLDLLHADLQHANGSTRVRWWLDFTRGPAGLQPGLEAELGCTTTAQCAVFSGADLDRLVANEVSGDEPRDNVGHGTHVASLAAGDGSSQEPARYAGIAPEAELVVVRITGGQGGISDSAILRSVRFVFDRAAELALPAVVNLSLGSDLGAHDGSSALERGLTSLIGPEHPGRAIVVAAGNSGGLFKDSRPPYAGPLGVHTQVHVPRGSPTVVPILTPSRPVSTTRGRITLWLSARPGDALRIGFERDGALLGPLAEPGSIVEGQSDGLEVTLLNDLGLESDTLPVGALLIQGEWPSGEAFGLRLEGHGTASMWLSGDGELDEALSPGPLFPRAQKEGTINVPASAPELIAVGATLNRTDWLDADGRELSLPASEPYAGSPADSSAYFSAAGPNALGVMKPDLVAPGAYVTGALSALADPRGASAATMFSNEVWCGSVGHCLVNDDFHALASGTSMAAPLVSGAVALLFERDPSLTQAGVRALLQAGARSLGGTVQLEQQVGIGALDLEGALSAQAALDSPLHVLPGSATWLALAASFAHPDPAWPVLGYAELRDDAGRLADGFDLRRLSLRVEGAELIEPLTRIAPGLHRFSFAAPSGSGGSQVRVALAFDGDVLTQRELPIAVDRGVLFGVAAPRGGCAFAAHERRGRGAAAVVLTLLVAAWRRRRA